MSVIRNLTSEDGTTEEDEIIKQIEEGLRKFFLYVWVHQKDRIHGVMKKTITASGITIKIYR